MQIEKTLQIKKTSSSVLHMCVPNTHDTTKYRNVLHKFSTTLCRKALQLAQNTTEIFPGDSNE